MAETTEKKPAAETRHHATPLARASESGDAEVQALLALKQTHQTNGDSAKVTDVERQLAGLGYA